MRRKGFTLIELLVVIAIIVILAGILFPAFAAARRSAYNAVCLSNLKQIGMAVSMYAQDYDEAFPAACSMTDRYPFPPAVRAQPSDWPNHFTPYLWDVVAPYVKNPGIWRCPGDIGFTVSSRRSGKILIDFRPSVYDHPNYDNPGTRVGSSYQYNTDLVWIDGNPGYFAPLTVSAIQRPADTFLVAEPAGHWHNSTLAPPILLRTPANDTSNTYHYNGVCVDGHAKNVSRHIAADDCDECWNRDRSKF